MRIADNNAWATPQESAAFMREALRRAFPGVRFKVRMSRGTAWGSYHIEWTGGPNRTEVEAVTIAFEGKGFDGMTDSTTYTHKFLPDGRFSGIGYIHTNRHD